MSSTTSPEGLNRSRPFNANPSKEALGTVCGTIYSSASVFRFLAETFGALHATDADLTLAMKVWPVFPFSPATAEAGKGLLQEEPVQITGPFPCPAQRTGSCPRPLVPAGGPFWQCLRHSQ